MTIEWTSQIMTFGDHAVLDAYEEALGDLKRNQERVNHLEQELFRRIQARGGTSLPNADENGEQIWVCDQVDTFSSPRYNINDFIPFLEVLNQTELRECYTPKHDETVTVDAAFHTTKLKAIVAKRGLKWPEPTPTGRKLKFERIQRDN